LNCTLVVDPTPFTYGLDVVLIPAVSAEEDGRKTQDSPVWVAKVEHGEEWDEEVGGELEDLDCC
jgi:hypothetical protein